jgi:ketosteroid isomerase-like protein
LPSPSNPEWRRHWEPLEEPDFLLFHATPIGHKLRDCAMPRNASKKNVELLRRFYEYFNQGDIDALLELCSPEVEIYKDPDVVEMVAAFMPRGRERVAQYLRGWLDSWDAYLARPEEFLGSGEEVAVLTHLRARGRNSQFEIEEDMADVFTVRNGSVSRLRLYVQRTDALKAIGLDA